MTEGMCCSDPNLSPPLCTHTRTHTHTLAGLQTLTIPHGQWGGILPHSSSISSLFFISLSSYYFSWSSLSNARANTQNCWTSGLSLVSLKEQQQDQHTKKFLFDQQGPRFVISSGPDAAGMSETRRHWHTQTSEIEWERERVGCDVALECKWLHNLKETCVIPVVSSLFWVCVFFFCLLSHDRRRNVTEYGMCCCYSRLSLNGGVVSRPPELSIAALLARGRKRKERPPPPLLHPNSHFLTSIAL